ncbi:CPBP family intramembrane glutamic endopeptidase [Pseudobutyrivibrio sp.]|uniref:CPBP family intramembrane glutamic endopeptidase n=1 Tax=Pseudobutyrivibrio sp. TaxID=2014367 RepID=UPI001E090594|nr:CPBP family intramembrane glutamic endopeptidase [Pseudobutyrivibrio sp.]MBE5909667.1 CPBP family intramembrane metalloprotease [Pseudobutyrivibrio sp.]
MDTRIKRYVLLSYLVFWIMVIGICGTASMVFHCPPVVMRILSNICAWSPTLVLLAGFKYFSPNKSIRSFYKKAFGGKVSFFCLGVAGAITAAATLLSVFILSIIENSTFNSYWSLGTYPFWASFLFSITTGPTGEESGWRGYLRPYLNSKYSFFKASVIQGVIWAFWHAVLWFVDSDFMGIEMLPYIISNVMVMTGLCFIMNYFMEEHDNLIYGIVVHFCFNFLYCFLKVNIWFYVILSIIYIFIIGLICLTENKKNSKIFNIDYRI